MTADLVVAAVTARRAVRSGALWGAVFGVAVASSAVSYTTIYRTRAQRDALAAAYGSNNATSALFGPAPHLQTVAGFTVFKISMTLIVLGAVWGLLISTRLLRGEEDEGRWELLLTGLTTRGGATAQALAGLGSGVCVLWALTAGITVLTGRDSTVHIAAGPALYFALALVVTAGMFLGVGAVTSQLCATRRRAAAGAATVLGVSYAVRMLADAGVGLHGLIWASPLGWAEELRPLTAPRPLPLLPIVAFTAALSVLAVRLAGSRDVGASIVGDRTTGRPRLRLLSGPTGLAIRLELPTITGWWVAIAVSGLLFGLIAPSAGATIAGSPVQAVLSKFGAAGSGPGSGPGSGADVVLGVCFLVIAVLEALLGAGQLTAARSEEAAGRLDQLLVHPVTRWSWLRGRLLIGVAALVVGGVTAGVAAWVGATSQHAGVGFTALVEAGVNLVPPAVAISGLGVLAYGLRPRLTSTVVYALLGWSVVVLVVGGTGASTRWVLDASVFHQLAAAPAVSPNWAANGVMTAVGVAGALLGAAALRRRDLQGE